MCTFNKFYQLNLCRCNFYYKIHTILFLAETPISYPPICSLFLSMDLFLSLNLNVIWRRIWTEWGSRKNFPRTKDFFNYQKWLSSEFSIRNCFNSFFKRNETAKIKDLQKHSFNKCRNTAVNSELELIGSMFLLVFFDA
jgi:hypothetical protein